MSSMCSMPTETRTRSGGDPARPLLLVAELLVGGGGGVDDEGLGVADVREVAGEPHAVDELAPGVEAALDAERQHDAEAVAQVLLRERVRGVRREARVAHPRHRRVRLQPRRELGRVVVVPLHPQRQRLEPLEEQERVERRQAGPEVAQALDPGADGEGDVAEGALRAERLPEVQAVVAGAGSVNTREPAVAPVEPAGVHDHAADRGAVAADPLGGRGDDDVGAEARSAGTV